MIKQYEISKDDSIYEAFPDVETNSKGELICVFLECKHHNIREDVRIMITKSSDKGKTWSKKQVFAESKDSDMTYNCPRISRLPDGSMVIICDLRHRTNEHTKSENHVWRSYDDGKTWAGPEELNIPGIVPDKYRVLSNGRHFFAVHLKGENDKLIQYGYYSDDEGKNWTEVTIGADSRYNLCEASIVEVKPGTLVAFMRENSFLGYSCKKSISYDYGTTWEGVFDTNIDACHRPVVNFYDEGKLMMTYRFYQGGRGGFGASLQNLFAAFFDVETALAKERTQQTVRIFPVAYDRSSRADTGYSGWVKFEDGTFYVVNYLLDDAPNAQIRGYEFSLKNVFAYP